MLISPQSDKRHINIINAITLNITAINAKIPEGETAKCPLLITVAAAIVIMEITVKSNSDANVLARSYIAF